MQNTELKSLMVHGVTGVLGAVTTSASFSGLTQGKRYTVSVTTRTKKDPIYGNVTVQYTTPQSLTVYTKPGKPGKLIKETHSAPDVTLRFNRSDGTVSYYIVTVDGTDVNVSSSPLSPLQAAFTLRNTGTYTVTIVAHSNGIVSDPQTDTIVVEAARAGKVSGLSVPQYGSRWSFVTWMKPDNPNGEINAYTVKLLNGSMHCIAGTAVLCSNCTKTSPEAPSVEECDAVSNISLTSSQLLDPVGVNVTALQPDVQYTVRVNAYNEIGKGEADDGTVTTQQEAAPTLKSVTLTTPGDNQILVSWEPQERTGPTTYTVSWEERESLTSNTFVAKGSINITGYTNTSHLIPDLLSYWEYQVTVFPFTPVADPPAAVSTKVTMTTPTQPEEVNFTITQPPDSARTVILTASCPEEKKRNGPITSISYNATVTGQGAYQMSAPQGSIAVTSSNCQGTKEIDVVAEAAYSFNVFAETDSLVGEMSTKNVTVQAKPPKLEKPDGSQLVQEVEGRSTTSTVTLQVCACVVSPKDGHIVEAGIILCVKSSTDQCQPESGKQEQTKYGQLPTWKQFMDGGASGSYRVTRDNFHTTIASAARTRRSVYRRVARSAADFVSYTVGDEQCDQVDSSQYCNGPLPEDKTFNVIIWACTSEGCTESDDVIIVRTQADDDGPPVGAIVGAVVAVVVAAIIVAVIVVVVVLRRKKKKSPERPPSPAPLTAIRKPVPLKAFAAHLERLHKDSNLLFQEEFEDIQERSAKHSQEASVLDVNKVKNRYVNILPYDFSRVKLSTDDDDVTTDFINANYIPGYTSQREYIATQGPMVATFSDFWRMMWEQKSSLIVMLSDLQERGRPKVDMYWPGELHAPLQYDDIIVELTTSSTLNKYTIRTFTLHKEDQKEDMRRVVQYFIPGWEDYSANLQSEDVLDFISTVRQEARSSQGPIVVHCSAGVGRTGTFIALDFLKQFVEEHSLDDEVDIFNLVLNMRHYRPLMVQSEGQYVFIHDTLKVIIEQKIKAMQEEENHIYGNTTDNNVYGNAPDNIYGNTVSSEEVYVNQAFEPEDDTYQNADLKPTTAL
ncbi:uncharacterized protein LOC143283031 isoform X2 [Babylonia areolata]|uniref:uncharacterized protein LOC143283031 isoform X2 n=1 Tax=Babylonia areolata TaxID=304850 RepID=UPI003FD549BE